MKQIGLTSDPEEQTENILTGICREEDTTVFNYYLDIFLDSNEYLNELIHM